MRFKNNQFSATILQYLMLFKRNHFTAFLALCKNKKEGAVAPSLKK